MEVLEDRRQPTAIRTLSEAPSTSQDCQPPLPAPVPSLYLPYHPITSLFLIYTFSQLRSCFSLFKSAFLNQKKANRSHQSSFTYLSSSWQKSRLKPICAGGQGYHLPRSLFKIHQGFQPWPYFHLENSLCTGCSVYCRMLSSIPDLYLLDANSTSPKGGS